MITVHGVKSLTMVRYGTRVRWKLAGLLIAMGIGTGLARGAGPGWIMRLGALLHSTMGAGRSSAAPGAGALVRSMRGRSTDQRLWDLLVEDTSVSGSDLAEASAEESAGFPSDSASRIIRGIEPAEITIAM
jgi:hypothetical protein